MENNHQDSKLLNAMLVAIFIDKEDLDICLQEIFKKFNVIGEKVFVLSVIDCNEDSEYILTFNIESSNKQKLAIDNIGKIIRIHRRKDTNTLYTINALNFINKENKENHFWEKYKFCFLTVSNNNLKVIKTKLFKIHTNQ